MPDTLEQPATATAESGEHVLELVRIFKAPRSLVWDAFTKAEHVARWWGPRGLTTRVEQHDFRVGGRTRYVMVAPDGAEYPAEGTLIEIEPKTRFVSTDEFGDREEGDGLPDGMILTAVFEDVAGGTRLTIRVSHPTAEILKAHLEMGVVGGWHSSFDCLDDFLREERPGASADREIIVSRLLFAPRELVFDAWSDIDQISNWWGPRGFSTTTQSVDFRPGGTWRFTMHGPDGTDFENVIVYESIDRPELISYRHAGEGETADVRFLSTVTFEEQPDGTLVTLHSLFDSAEVRDRVAREYGAVEGGHDTLARLSEHVGSTTAKSDNGAGGDGSDRIVDGGRDLEMTFPSDTEVRLVRSFNAPRDNVFEAFTKPEHIRRWWGSADYAMTTCEMDFRVGGEWRFVQRTPDGVEHPFRGEYLEISRPDRLVYTFIYDVEYIRDFPSVETVEFVEKDGRTTLINTVKYASKEARDGHLESGMESGARESMDRLAVLLLSLDRQKK